MPLHIGSPYSSHKQTLQRIVNITPILVPEAFEISTVHINKLVS
jgi:hypothetical protein